MKRFYVFMAVLFALSGCSSPKNEIPAVNSAASASAPLEQRSVDSSSAAKVIGKISFQGQAPEPRQMSVRGNPECAVLHPGGSVVSEELVVNNGALQHVFVYIKEGLEGYSFTAPTQAAVMDNKACVYVPHVMGVRVGQPVDFVNKDSTLHNIHSYSSNQKAFNLGLPLVGMKQTKKFDAPEIMVSLKCDVHPWMQGYIGVVAHPYFAVSDAQGQFDLKNVPPGNYTLEAWHEKLGAQTQNITLSAGETKQIEFKFPNS